MTSMEKTIAAVREDIWCHNNNGVDLNPYTTQRARQSWQNGFDGNDVSLLDWADCHQRGKVAGEMTKETK